MSEQVDGCEYDPVNKRLALAGEQSHAPAEVILGTNGDYRLCISCSVLPEFRHYRVSRPIKRHDCVASLPASAAERGKE